MSRPLAVLCLLAGCVKNADDSKDKPHGGDDTSDTGDTDDSGGEWGPADVEPGAYRMVYSTVKDATCGRPLKVGGSELVIAPVSGPTVNLWGYVPLESSGSALRARGERTVEAPKGDCTVTEKLNGQGELANRKSFTLDVVHEMSGKGKDCAAVPIPLPCVEVYGGEFTWEEPPDTGGK